MPVPEAQHGRFRGGVAVVTCPECGGEHFFGWDCAWGPPKTRPCVAPGCGKPGRLYPGGWYCDRHRPGRRVRTGWQEQSPGVWVRDEERRPS